MDEYQEWTAEGSGWWSEGRCRFTWSLRNVTAHNHLMNFESNNSVLMVSKAKMRDRGAFKQLLWIQYTEALVDGKIYTPAASPQDPNPWPWIGIDRYPNTIHRKDHLPYVSLPDEQRRVDWGHAYEGRIKSLYDNKDSDTVNVDWASSGYPNWGHYSVLTLIGRGFMGAEWSIGSIAWRGRATRPGTLNLARGWPSPKTWRSGRSLFQRVTRSM